MPAPASAIDGLIYANRIANPVPPALLEQRVGDRLTIQQINQMNDAAIAQGMVPRMKGDIRTATERFLDVVDLPRNAMANIIWGDPDTSTIAGGIGSVAGWGALYGSLAGSFAGPAGTALGAAGGAVVAGGVAAGAYAAGAVAGAFVGESGRRRMASKARRGTFGAPVLYTSDALESMGVESPVVRAVVGLAGDIMLDPTTYLSGGGNVAVKLGSQGQKMVLNKGGSRMLRQYANIVATTGQLPTDPVLSRFNHLFAHKITIGTDTFDVGESVSKLPKMRDLVESYLKQIPTASGDELAQLQGELAKAQRQLRTSLEREIVDLATSNLAEGPVQAFRGKIGRDFAREFAARSTHQITMPFASFFINRMPGYHSGNIAVGGFGEPGRLSKFLGKSEDEFAKTVRQSMDAEIEALRQAKETALAGRYVSMPQSALPKMSSTAQAASEIDEAGNIRVPMTALRFDETERMIGEGWMPNDTGIPFVDMREVERTLDQIDEPRRQARKADLSSRLAKIKFEQDDAAKSLDAAKINADISAALSPDADIQKWQDAITNLGRERALVERDLSFVADARSLSIESALDTMEGSFREGDVATGMVGPLATIRRITDTLFGQHGPVRWRELEIQASKTRQEEAFASRVLSVHKKRLEDRLARHARFSGERVDRRLALDRGTITEGVDNISDSIAGVRSFEQTIPVDAPPRPKFKSTKLPKGTPKDVREASRNADVERHKQAMAEWRSIARTEHHQPVPMERVPRWVVKGDRDVNVPGGGKATVVRHSTKIPASPEIADGTSVAGRVSNKGGTTSFDIQFQSKVDRMLYEAARDIPKADKDAVTRQIAARRWVARTLGIGEGKATGMGRRLIAEIEKQVFGFSPTVLPAKKALKIADDRKVFIHEGRLVSANEIKALKLKPEDFKPVSDLLEPDDYVTLSPVRAKEARKVVDEFEDAEEGGEEVARFVLMNKGTAAGHAPGGRHFVVPPSQIAADRERIASEGLRFRYMSEQQGLFLPWEMTRGSKKNMETLLRMGGIAREQLAETVNEAADVRQIIEDMAKTEEARIAAKFAAHAVLEPINAEIGKIKDSLPYNVSQWIYRSMNETRTALNLNANLRFKAIINKYRAASEEQLAVAKRTQMKWISKAIDGALKETGADPALLNDAIIHRVVSLALENDARSVVGFLPDDPFITFNLPKLREKAPQLIGNQHVEAIAKRIHETWNDFLQLETHLGILPDDAASIAYLPIVMEERMRESYYETLRRLGEPMKLAGTNKLTTNPAFSLRRSTNRMLYGPEHEDLILALAKREKGSPLPPDLAVKIGRANVRSDNSVFSGQLWGMTPGDPNSHPFEAWRLDFLRRALDRGVDLATPRDRKLLGLPGGMDSGPVWLPQEFPTSPMMLNHRRDVFNESGANMISGPIFEEDIITLFSNRAGQHIEARATAKFVEEVVPLLKPITAEEAAGYPRGFQPGTIVKDGVEYRPINPKIVRDDRLNLFSFIPDAALTERYMWPVAFANSVEDMARKLSSESRVTGVLRGVQQVQNVWKGANLFLSPSWWTGNMLSGGMMSYLIGGSRPQNWGRQAWLASGLVKDIHNGGTKMDAAKFVIHGETYTGKELKELAVQGGVASAGRTMIEIGNLTRMGAEPSGRFAKLIRGGVLAKWYGKWFDFNAQTDDVWRFVTMIDLMEQGNAPEHAINAARLAHVDFGDFSFLEAKYGTLMFPFYRWMAGNMKLQLRTALEKPGYAAMFPKLREALSEGFESEESLPVDLQPKWMRDNIAVQIGDNENMKFAMIKTLTPAQELFELAAAGMGTDGLIEFMSYATSSLNPILKFPFELTAQKELFSGRDIGDNPGDVPWATYWTNHVGLFRRFDSSRKKLAEGVSDPVGEAARFVFGGSRIATTTPDRLSASFTFENRQTSENLRARIRAARKRGDMDEARQLAVELNDVWRRLYQLGYVDMVPKSARNTFREDARRERLREQADLPASS